MKQNWFGFLLLAVVIILAQPIKIEAQTLASLWGNASYYGESITPDTAAWLTGEYPTTMCLYTTTNQLVSCTNQTFTGAGNIYFIDGIPLGTYRLKIRVQGVMSTCINQINIRVAGSIQLACNYAPFINGSSTPMISSSEYSLQVCADNLFGQMVYATLYRDAANGYPANTWYLQQVASSNCVTFRNMDGVGNLFTGVRYYSVASLTPISSLDARLKRTSCAIAIEFAQLCDSGRRN